MLHRLPSLVAILLILAAPLRAEGERAGAFDYYVLALSWSPTWCALEGEARKSPQCAPGRNFGWVLHGLWPQYEDGYPSYCPTARRAPPRSMTAGMEDIMGAPGVAWYQWKKHGTCSGLEARDYYRLARHAYESVRRPEVFRKLARDVRVPASVIEDAFVEANPDLDRDMVTVTCRSGRIQEVRICLTRALEPRICGTDVRRDCRSRDALLDAID